VTGRPVVYWIHTEWCTTCKRIRPEWPSIVDAYGSAVQLIMVDRDTPEGNAFARSHRINYQPGFVVLDANGNVTYAGLGPYTPAEVRQLVASAAARSSASR
jgi:thiol-disulfide isomerase/thioredoxin